MKAIRTLLLFCFAIFAAGVARAQDDEWPKVINAADGSVIKVYEPQPESFTGNILKSRSAISVLQNGATDPIFGTFWSVATVETDRDNHRVSVQSVHVPNLKFASDSDTDADKISYLKTLLESELPKVETDLSLDALLSSLDMNAEQKKLSKDLNTKAPNVIYANKPTILVLIDGEPKFKRNSDWGVDAVVNSPYTIVKNTDGSFYLYGGKQWYTAPSVTGPYSYVSDVPGNLQKIGTAVNNLNNSDPGYSDSAVAAQSGTVSNIIVSTQPAELIQSKGDPSFKNIDGTNLQYADNSANDIFYDQGSRLYFVLISGRWYKSPDLQGNWQYTASNALPADFAKIPEGSPKDNVLASVAGTDAAREAVMDAQIPQTAKVDRHSATATVTYDGAPQFQDILGTHLQYAVNSPTSVIRMNNRYYCVDKGVWFVADDAMGPWSVSTDRPDDVESIPPSSPAYNLKYVYVYDATPDYVYMGYTPGYLNSFVYGPTVVYGTGFNYTPWFGNYYYPRPYTWGFGMNYNPWAGWGFGFGYNYGWFNVGFGASAWGGWGGGWWGPSIYRPPYYFGSIYRGGGFYHGGGYYGRGGGYYGRGGFAGGRAGYAGGRQVINGGRAGFAGGRVGVVNRTNVNITNNIYNHRRDVITNNNGRNNGNVFNGGRNNGASPNNNGGRFNNGGNGTAPNNNGGRTYNPAGNAGGRTTTPGVGQAQPGGRTPVYSDRSGNVYQRNQGGQWQQRDQHQWAPVNNNRPEVIQNLNRQQQMQNRGQQNTQNFNTFRSGGGNVSRPAPSGGSRPSGGGGGGRPSGGGGGRRH